jgi:hypothetical protein
VGQPHLLDLVEAPFAAGEQDLADHSGVSGSAPDSIASAPVKVTQA